jgi:hypothetical protein
MVTPKKLEDTEMIVKRQGKGRPTGMAESDSIDPRWRRKLVKLVALLPSLLISPST